MFKKQAFLVLLWLFFGLLLTACGDSPTATPTTAATSATNPTTAATSAATNPTTVAATSGSAKTTQSVVIALSYIPNVQFAPFYVAKDKGYFAEEGLTVTFQYGSIDNLMGLVGTGQVPFALASGDEVLQARAGGFPVTYIATNYQKYPVALASLKSKGIKTAADLKGKTIGIPGPFGSTYIGLKAILAAARLTEDDVKIQTIGFTQREAISQGKVDAAMVYSMNEPVQLQKAGLEINVIEVSSLSSIASVGLVTGEGQINNNPDLVKKVVRATTRGIKDTIANPDAAFESSVKVAPEAKGDNPDLQKAVLKETVRFMTADNVKDQPYGYSDPKVWDASVQFLFDNKLIKTKVDPTTVYSNKFVSAEIGKY